ncbi:MAG TPA: DUF4251 domain-containing protein [Puia sp.]|nr:DUF4251 domain-containing protein [Puia sp.]
MKFRNPFRLFMPLLLLISAGTFAQITKEEKKKAEYEKLSAIIEARQYTFVAQTATSMSGRSRQLTGIYTLKIHHDSLEADLPYFGRAYSATPGDTNGGINFSSTAFSYTIKNTKNGGWFVTIIPENKNKASKLDLSISGGGFGTLQVTSTNRDMISFYGNIRPNSNPK